MANPSEQPISVREYDARHAELERNVALVRENAQPAVALRQYIEALFAEHEKALDMASREREKAAEVLAEALRAATKAGDDRLREHIENQVEQIRGSLLSADKLEQERVGANAEQIETVDAKSQDRAEALRRELILVTEAQRQAVAKAEEAQQEINKRNNDYRGQLADQAATLMPRKETEATVSEVRSLIDKVEDLTREGLAAHEARIVATNSRIDTWGGERLGGSQAVENASRRVNTNITAAVAFLSFLVILVNIAIATHGFK